MGGNAEEEEIKQGETFTKEHEQWQLADAQVRHSVYTGLWFVLAARGCSPFLDTGTTATARWTGTGWAMETTCGLSEPWTKRHQDSTDKYRNEVWKSEADPSVVAVVMSPLRHCLGEQQARWRKARLKWALSH